MARCKPCYVKPVVSKHDMVVLLAAVSAHLFGLTEGSIPSATTGDRALAKQSKKRIFFPLQKCGLAGCNNFFLGGSHQFIFCD